MEEVIGELEVELDGRFSSIRNNETNLGNFITDIIHNVTEVDCVILNSGTLRSDTLHPPGKFKMKDLAAILPMPDVLVVLELTGDQILEALENGVSQWPKLEGRFPQVAGMRFSFNPKQDPGCRILKPSVSIDSKPLDRNKTYKVCTKSYLARGKDGYRVFAKAKVLVDEEDGPILGTIVRNHFRSINIVRGVTKSKSSHRQSLIMRHKEDLGMSDHDVVEKGWDSSQHASWRHRPSDVVDVGDQRSSQELFLNLEKEHTCIAPQVEGRITTISDAEDYTDLTTLKPEGERKTEDFSKASKTVMENGNSEVTKSLGNETLPVKTDVRESEEENPQEGTENAGEYHKDGDVKEMLALSDQTAGQDIKQDTDKVGEEQYGNNIHQEEGGMQNIETSGQEVKNNDEQIKVEKSPDQINSSDDQRSQEPNKVDSNEHPPKVEDKSADSPPEQEMDNALQLGPDLATEDEYWDLWEAVKVDDIELVKSLRQEKNIRFTRFQDNKTILHLGAERNAARVVTYLLTEGKLDPNITDEILQGVPLHGAAEYGSVDAARILLEHGAEINKQDLIGNTALHIACEHEQGGMKTFLVDQGADTTVVNSDGEVPAL